MRLGVFSLALRMPTPSVIYSERKGYIQRESAAKKSSSVIYSERAKITNTYHSTRYEGEF